MAVGTHGTKPCVPRGASAWGVCALATLGALCRKDRQSRFGLRLAISWAAMRRIAAGLPGVAPQSDAGRVLCLRAQGLLVGVGTLMATVLHSRFHQKLVLLFLPMSICVLVFVEKKLSLLLQHPR